MICSDIWHKYHEWYFKIATKKDFISMYHGALVSGFVNISVYFNKLVNNLNHLIDFFKNIKILLVIQSEN